MITTKLIKNLMITVQRNNTLEKTFFCVITYFKKLTNVKEITTKLIKEVENEADRNNNTTNLRKQPLSNQILQ